MSTEQSEWSAERSEESAQRSPDGMERSERRLTASSGIVVRQAFKGSDDRTRSPDIIVAPGTAAFDPSVFTDLETFNWDFGQVPALGSANAVYVRGVNYTGGKQTSTVYLYAVPSDKLLDPTAWSSAGFTVGGTAQNYTTISALTLYQIVATDTPVQWTPPTPAGGVHYLLISWVDNSTQPTPPTFPTTPFKDRAALLDYVQAHPQLAVLDTSYAGAFMRQFPRQTPTQNGTGAQTSPDIVLNSNFAARDAAKFATSASYESTQLNSAAVAGQRNFVYLRAFNATPGPASARVYLYWTITGVSPTSWQTSGFSYAGKPQNWVDLLGASLGDVMVSTVPIVWDAPTVGSGQTCLLIAYIDTSDNPSPPDFTPFGYLTMTAVTKFVAATPRLSWLAVTNPVVPPTPTMSWQEPVGSIQDADLYVGIELHDIPVDGSFSFSVPGPDAASTIVVDGAKIPANDVFVGWSVRYPAGFASSAVLTYLQGATKPSGSPSIVLRIVPRPAR